MIYSSFKPIKLNANIAMFRATEVAEEHRFLHFQHISAAQEGSCFLVDNLLGEPHREVEIQSGDQSVLTWRIPQHRAQSVYPSVELFKMLWFDQ